MIEPQPLDLGAERQAMDWLHDARSRGLDWSEIYAARPDFVVDQMASQTARLQVRVDLLRQAGRRAALELEAKKSDEDERRLEGYVESVEEALALDRGASLPAEPEELWVIWDRNAKQAGAESVSTDVTH